MSFIFSGAPTSRGVMRDFRNNNINNVTTNRIPFYTTVSRPTPNPANKGQIIYDTTLNQFCYCNGMAWICIGGGSASTAGIVDCTVGSVANPNADYNSVQAALTAGCLNIRILDGLIGGQVPGYFEPGPISFSAVGAPVMIYVGPGVDWELRQSVVGTGGIDMTGSVVVFRGSGVASIIRQLQDEGAPASVFALNDASQIQWMDLTFITSAEAVAFPVPMGRLIWRNCQYVLISASLAAYSFTTVGNSSGNQIEFHECTFIAFDMTSRMIDNADGGNNGALTLTNCTHQGSSLDPTTDVTYRFGTVGGQITVDGFELFGTDPMSMSFGGVLSSFNSIYQNGTGAVTAIMTGTRQLNNGRFDTIIFPSGSNTISNVEITSTTAVDISSTANRLDEVSFALAPLMISSTFNILNGGSADSLAITSTDNRVSNYDISTSLSVDGAENNISRCTVGTTTVLGPTAVTTGSNIQGSNLAGAVTIGGTLAVTNNSLSGNQINGSVSIGGVGVTTGNVLTGNNIQSTVGTPTLTVGTLGGGISQDCVIDGNFVEGLLTVNNSVGIMETDNCVFSGNRFPGGVTVSTDSATGSQPLFTGNIISGGGATGTVTNGHANGTTNSAP
uniref:Uncharacterized protein n=1 Tax=Marseillevirus LCMAC101 TaxID=2506602 RepID=A0A481YRB7_9VIRU|nr:MAG: hypothetical protein LCMAC101_00440 [Marseillevirus LCMAC101]